VISFATDAALTIAGDCSDWQANEFGHELGQPIVVTLG